jgi:hypothetical protein
LALLSSELDRARSSAPSRRIGRHHRFDRAGRKKDRVFLAGQIIKLIED